MKVEKRMFFEVVMSEREACIAIAALADFIRKPGVQTDAGGIADKMRDALSAAIAEREDE